LPTALNQVRDVGSCLVNLSCSGPGLTGTGVVVHIIVK